MILRRIKILDRIFNYCDIEKKLLSNGKSSIPFVPSKLELENNNIRIVYNAVGGQFYSPVLNKLNEKIASCLREADFISVRDLRTKEDLKERNVNATLVPDSALIISDIIDKNKLNEQCTLKKSLIERKYLFLQLGNRKGPENLEKFASEIEKVAENLELKIILCPIGLAPLHEDQKILKELVTKFTSCKLVIPKNIYDIIYLISNSSAYFGTSLHGMITAQSYGVPFIPLNKSIVKLSAYCSSWTPEFVSECMDFEMVADAIKILKNWDHQSLKEITLKQKALVYDNFKKIEEYCV